MVDVFVQIPYYFGYVAIVDMVSTASWNPQANISSEFTIEIVTLVICYICMYSTMRVVYMYRHPNNPNGELRKPLVQDHDHVIYDMVYYWPMYTKANTKMSEVCIVFMLYVIPVSTLNIQWLLLLIFMLY